MHSDKLNLSRIYESPYSHSAPYDNVSDLPNELFISKYEETDILEDENSMDNYYRNTLRDYTGETAYFEHEQPRGDNLRGGHINLWQNGALNDSEPAKHPEAFLGFMGEDNRDPRGINVDPDFNRIREEEFRRAPLVNYTRGDIGHLSVTSGGRSRYTNYRDRIEADAIFKNRAKIFTTSREGESPRMLIWSPDYVGAIRKQKLGGQNGLINWEEIGDYLENAQRTIGAPPRVINEGAFKKSIQDMGFKVAKYQIPSHRNTSLEAPTHSYEYDSKMSQSESNLARTLGVLMSDIAKSRRGAKTDQDKTSSKEHKTTKGIVHKDSINVFKASLKDMDFTGSKISVFGRQPIPGEGNIRSDVILSDKQEEQVATISKILRRQYQMPINTMKGFESMADAKFEGGKVSSNKLRRFVADIKENREQSITNVNGVEKTPFVYKSSNKKITENKIKNTDYEDFKGEENITALYKTNDARGDIIKQARNSQSSFKDDNTFLERKLRGMGDKRKVRYQMDFSDFQDAPFET